ncbi:MAG: hypothetical protein KF773_28640 [Deltaproteobacteria bacterium]|nr:hypothetical protein [Deltaproteobacteria bacterium]
MTQAARTRSRARRAQSARRSQKSARVARRYQRTELQVVDILRNLCGKP